MAAKNYLPIGSIVLVKDSAKRFMIYGRRQVSVTDNKEYDYIGCMYPEGFLNSKKVFLFNHEDIQMIYFIGFQDVEELHFRTLLKDARTREKTADDGAADVAEETTENVAENVADNAESEVE